MTVKKICIVSTIPADPRNGGNGARIFGLARDLQDMGHAVHFVHLPSRRSPPYDAEHHQATFGQGAVHLLNRGSPLDEALYYGRRAVGRGWRKALSLARSARRHYHALDEIFPGAFSRQLRRLQASQEYDVAIAVYVFNSKALLAFPGALKILDTHDRFADRHLVYEDAGLASIGYSISAPTENRGFRRADVILAIQEGEADLFRRQLGAEADRVHCVSYGLDLSRRVSVQSPDAAAFLGSSFTANTQAARHFVREILPRIRAQAPEFQAYFAGSIDRDVEDGPGVVKLGRVPSISDAFERGPICLNPILIGTGINIKLLDAMAAGVPAISTATGVRGLPERFRDSVIVVPDDDPQAFADAAVGLGRDAPRRAALGELAAQNGARWNAEQRQALQAALGAPRRA